jgi:hypothetical protein
MLAYVVNMVCGCYFLYYRPHQRKLDNYVDSMNEVFIIILGMHLFFFSDMILNKKI